MARKPTGRPNGRPPKAAQAAPAAAAVQQGLATAEDAAQAHGVGKRTVQRYQAAARQAALKPPAKTAPAARPSAPARAPKGRREALLALLGAVLDAEPDLLAELPLDAEELGRRLAEPALPPMPDDKSPIAIVEWVETVMAREATKLTPAAAVARRQALALVVQAAKGRAAIMADMPIETETPEAMAGRKIRERRDAAFKLVLAEIEIEEART